MNCKLIYASFFHLKNFHLYMQQYFKIISINNDSICLYFLFDAYTILDCDCENKISKNKKKNKRNGKKSICKIEKNSIYIYGVTSENSLSRNFFL